ncbi:MAG: family 10 glycosylhydrolase [Oscillospiraceae bacterium]|jgi:uncharacterized lipoprotein YddW (UPF0748 family)|nr:family 10 glycosylhydrolase [Oscillospiraceae bacterium]
MMQKTERRRNNMPALLAAVCFFLTCFGCAAHPIVPSSTGAAPSDAPLPQDELRAVWISYYELTQDAKTTREQFAQRYWEIFSRIKTFGLNTVFLHVRSYSDAIYPSDIFPWSATLTGVQGKSPGYDPLAILLGLAAKTGLKIHAWINPFRVVKTVNVPKLAAKHPAKRLIAAGDRRVLEHGGYFYWNPALPENHALLCDGVRELLENYPQLAGVHIDDYFYPTAAPAFDAPEYKAYLAAGGEMDLPAWRRELVSACVAGLYRTTKRVNANAVFSISPSSNIEKNRDEMFADVERWLREPGFCDWMLPQTYFGFEHYKLPFADLARRWDALAVQTQTHARLAFGLAAYKCGTEDVYAGTGRQEWLAGADILARQLRLIRTLQRYSGFSIYSCESFFGGELPEIARKNMDNFQIVLGGAA